ncbi:MAG: NfeD family protein [Candidatus Thorarchaeota archaeon]
MDAWIKIFVVMILMTAMSLVMGFLIHDPFVGLIFLGVLLTLMVLTLEPATGKAMAQITIPLVIILFVFQIFLNPSFEFDLWMLFIIGAVLYMMFAMFTGGAGVLEGGFMDAKIALKLFPIYGIAIFISVFADPSRRTTVYIMVATVIGMMVLYMAFLRDYDKWPEYEYGKMYNIVAIEDIRPKGKVKSGAEIWWARTDGPPIAAGENVRVIGVSGMTMIVVKEDSFKTDHSDHTDQ